MLLIAANVNFSKHGAGEVFLAGINSFWHLQSLRRLGGAACLCCEAESSAEFPFLAAASSTSLLSQHLLPCLRGHLFQSVLFSTCVIAGDSGISVMDLKSVCWQLAGHQQMDTGTGDPL